MLVIRGTTKVLDRVGGVSATDGHPSSTSRPRRIDHGLSRAAPADGPTSASSNRAAHCQETPAHRCSRGRRADVSFVMSGGTGEDPAPPPQHAVDCGMAFGQHAGPPATSRQVDELLALLQAAGHEDFRDARGPMGFTPPRPRQVHAGRGRAVDRPAAGGLGRRRRTTGRTEHVLNAEPLLRRMPAEQLAGELQRRGWLVIEP